MSWINYLLEANFYLITFYMLYYFIFRRETYYQLNRAFLLISSLVAYIIPVLQLGFLKPAQSYRPGNLVMISQAVHPLTVKAETIADHTWNMSDYYLPVYLLVVIILLINLAYKIYKLVQLSKINNNIVVDSYNLVETNGRQDAFSFFNYLFINPELSSKQTIIRHELIHIRQRHSWDILYFEVLKTISWFNPVVYLLQYSMKELHEFIADSETVKVEYNKDHYTDFLVQNAYGINTNALTSSFFNKSLLKNRIIMLHQKRSGYLARLKYLVALPVCAALLCASTLGFSKTYGWVDLTPGYRTLIATDIFKSDTLNGKIKVTSKGYKYQETGYLVNNKSNFRVIFFDGGQKGYFKNSATPAQLKLIKDKYGYEFPTMDIFPRLPPPPPMLIVKPVKIEKRPPPPPARPLKVGKVMRIKRFASPLVVKIESFTPSQLKLSTPPMLKLKAVKIEKHARSPENVKVDTSLSVKVIRKSNFHSILYLEPQLGTKSAPAVVTGVKPIPLIIANGAKYNLRIKLKQGDHLFFEASDSTAYYSPALAYTQKKWGDDGKNGVVLLYGKKISVDVK
jgi:hypothetical protein